MGRNKIMDRNKNSSEPEPEILYAEVIVADEAIASVLALLQRYPITTIVMGDQTTSKTWKVALEKRLQESVAVMEPSDSGPRTSVPVILVDERYSTLEARDRYWSFYPPRGWARLLPQSLRPISRPIDDIVAIILIERYLQKLNLAPDKLSVSSVP